MNIQNKIQNWNVVLLQADKKVKEVVDQATGQYYFEVAEYKNDNSMACKFINVIKEKTGKDWRFSFLNIDKVIFTTKHESNLEEFIKDYRFDINSGSFAYTNVTVKEFDAIKRSNALDKVIAREMPIQIEELVGGTTRGYTDIDKIINRELIKKNPPMILDTPKGDMFSSMLEELNNGKHKELREAIAIGATGRLHNSVFVGDSSPIRQEPKVELDDFAKELVAEFSKPEHKNTVKIVKSKDLGRGR